MKFSLHVAGAAAICLLLAIRGSSCADDSFARSIAETIVKNQAVQYLKGWKCEFKQPHCEAVAEAVEPEKHVKVAIREFTLLPHSVALTVSVDSRFAVHGKLEKGDETVAFKAEADASLLIAVVARFQEVNNEIVVRPKVKSLEPEVKILKVEPEDFPGGKDAMKEMLDAGLKSRRDRLVKDLNDWLARRRITAD